MRIRTNTSNTKKVPSPTSSLEANFIISQVSSGSPRLGVEATTWTLLTPSPGQPRLH